MIHLSHFQKRGIIILLAIALMGSYSIYGQVFKEVKEFGWGSGIEKARPIFTDLDNDGLYDVLIGNSEGNIVHYEQLVAGTEDFKLVNRNFNEIDVGENAIPAIEDFNDNGLLDLVIGNSDGKLFYYEQEFNDSTSFVLVSDNFNNIDVGENASPTFADVDNDGRIELVIGRKDSYLRWYEQTNPGSSNFSQLSTPNFSIGSYASPVFTDLDNDGLWDLIVGNSGTYGSQTPLKHFEQSYPGIFEFGLVTNSFIPNNDIISPFATFTDIDNNNKLDLITVNRSGGISRYETKDTANLVWNTVTNHFSEIDVGYNSAPVCVNLDNDGLIDLIIGVGSGGLRYYEQSETGSEVFNLISDDFIDVNYGSSLTPTFTDIDNDGLLDILIGNSFGQISHYEQDAQWSLEFDFITDYFNEIDVGEYSAPAIADIDHDGLLDLIIGNSSGELDYYIQDSPGSDSFNYISNGFDNVTTTNGSENKPVICDFDNDGLFDIFVGNQYSGDFYHFRQNNPNSTGFTKFTERFIYTNPNAIAAFCDIDNDGKNEMLIGDYGGSIKLLKKTGTNNDFWPRSDSFGGVYLTGQEESMPCITDFNGDGLFDFIIGKEDGTISYYKQTSPGNYDLQLVTNDFNSIDVGDNAAPVFIDIDNNGLLDLIIGEKDGNLNHYVQQSSGSEIFDLVTENFSAIGVGTYSTPSFTDLDSDGLLDLIVGNHMGTFYHYKQVAAGSYSFYGVTDNFSDIESPNNSSCSFADFDGNGKIDMVDNNKTHWEQDTIGSETMIQKWENINNINYNIYGAPFISDIDNDGLLDMIYSKGSMFGHNEQESVTHQFFGYPLNPQFLYYHIGSYSKPCVTDFNNDGKLDLIVGNSLLTQSNIDPFHFQLNSSRFMGRSLGSVMPSSTDLNNNGLMDLIFGSEYYEQISSGSDKFYFEQSLVGQYPSLAPAMYDIDGDGLLDMIIGDQNGNLRHYEQEEVSSTSFDLITNDFNFIDVGGYSSPAFVDLEQDGLIDLIVGAENGKFFHYKQLMENSETFYLVTDNFLGIDVMDHSTSCFYDIDNNGYKDMIIGNLNGDLHLFLQILENPPVVTQQPQTIEACMGNDISFSFGFSGSPIMSFQWQKDGENIEGAVYDTLTLNNVDETDEGGYRCILTNDYGTDTTDFAGLSVHPIPFPGYYFVANCIENPALFTDTSTISSGSITSWSWNFGDTGTSSSQNPVHNYSNGGNYDVQLMVESDYGCKDSVVKQINIQEVIADFSATAVCQGNPTQFEDNTVIIGDGEIIGWSWVFGDGNYSNLQNPEHIYENPGNFIVLLSAESNNNCVNTYTKIVTVYENLPVAIVIDASNNGICENEEIVFTATPENGGDNPNFQWQINSINVGANDPIFISNTLNNNDVVTCILTSSETCATNNPATSEPITITVFENLLVSNSIEVSSNPICQGEEATFTAFPENGGDTPFFQWQLNGMDIGENSQTYTSSSLVDLDEINCTVNSSETCTANNPATSNVVTMNVNQLPYVEIIPTPNDTVCISEAITLDAGNTGSTFYWSTNETTQQIEVSNSSGPSGGLQSYWVNVTNINGCEANDDIEVFFDPCTGMPENTYGITLEIYPNPTSSNIYLKLAGTEGGYSISITDHLGQIVWNGQIEHQAKKPTTIEIDLSKFQTGIYLLKVVNEDGVLIDTQKIIKH